MLLLTHSAGPIPSNFSYSMITQTGEALVSLDKRVYEGNPERLSSLADVAEQVFLHLHVGNRAAGVNTFQVARVPAA